MGYHKEQTPAPTGVLPTDNTQAQSDQQSNNSLNDKVIPIYKTIENTSTSTFISFAELLEKARNPTVGIKDNASALTPYKANTKKLVTAKKSLFYSLVQDHDDDDQTKQEIKSTYDRHDLAYLAFTSSTHELPKHGVIGKRWKVVIPLLKPIGFERYSMIAQGLTELHKSDKAQSRLQQVFYAPNKVSGSASYEYIDELKSRPLINALDDNNPLVRDALRAFHDAQEKEVSQTAAAKPKPKPRAANADNSIIDLVCDAYDLENILESEGNRKIGLKYLSSFSSSGKAGIVILIGDDGKKRCYSHHGEADPLSSLNNNGHALDVFDVICILGFSGDVGKCVAHYANELDSEGQKDRQRVNAQQSETDFPSESAETIQNMFSDSEPQAQNVDLLNPPGLAGQICQYIQSKARRLRPELYPLAALHYMASIGRNRESEYTTKFNLLTLGIASTAAGKEAPQNAVKTLSNEAGSSKHIHGGSGSFKDLIINLVEGEGSSLYVIDEVHSFLGAMKNKNAQTYETKMEAEILTMSTTELYTFRGMEKRQLLKEYEGKLTWAEKKLDDIPEGDEERQKFEVLLEKYERHIGYIENGWPNPFFSLMGHSVPENLDTFANPENIASGLLGRMLVVRCPNGRAKLSVPNKSLENELRESIIHTTDKIQADRRNVSVSKDAKIFLEECVDWYDDDVQLNDSIVGGIYARAPEHLYKVSSILGLDGGEIKLEHAHYAHALVKSSVDDIKYLILKGYAGRTDAEEVTILKHAKETVLKNCKGQGLRPSKLDELIKSCSGIKDLQGKDGKRNIIQEVKNDLIDTNHLSYEEAGQKKRYITTSTN